MPIVWSKPDGSVRVMRLSDRWLTANQRPTETTSEAVVRLASLEQAKNADLSDATATVVTTANIPVDRSQRHKWRLQGQRCVVDPTVPNPPHPKQGLLDAIDNATTLAGLKAAVRQMV